MAGIYVHIPFCKSKCHYCDFYSITNVSVVEELIQALIAEIKLRNTFLNGEPVDTIYFGGGTPSVLKVDDINRVLLALRHYFPISKEAEITVEINPDDVTDTYLNQIKTIGVNRLSLGVQSLIDSDLQLMNRRHDAAKAVEAVKLAQKCGFNNISVDLIYGLPEMTTEKLVHNIKQILNLNIQHISAYHLSVEHGTMFYQKWLGGELILPDDETSFNQFKLISETLTDAKFIHYEVSNFALNGFLSKHNSAYWNNKKYLGIGPSAHSFDGKNRYWNVRNLSEYLFQLSKQNKFYESESLDKYDSYNDYVMTSLRTARGADAQLILKEHKRFHFHFTKTAEKYQKSGHLIIEDDYAILTLKGMFVSDTIISDFFVVK